MTRSHDIGEERHTKPVFTGRTSAFLIGYLTGLAAPFHALGAVVLGLAHTIRVLASILAGLVASLLTAARKLAALVAKFLVAVVSGLLGLLLGLLGIAAAGGALFALLWLISAMWPDHSQRTPEPAKISSIPVEPPDKAPKISSVLVVMGPETTHAVEFVIYSRSCNWPKADTEIIVCGDEHLPGETFIRDRLLPHIRDKLMPGISIVSIGAASSEGKAELELPRALLRANKVAEWLAPRTGQIPIWVVSLGQFAATCADCDQRGTDWQRPLIVALIATTDANTDIAAVVRAALSQEPSLPKPSNYIGYASRRWR